VFMRSSVLLTAVVCLSLPGVRAWAQDSAKGSDVDTAAIRQTFADFYQSFSRQDAHATAMTFAEDGDFTNMFGIHIHGREAIEQRFVALFKGNLRGTNRTDTVRNIRFYSPGVAFVDADTVITGTKRADGSVGPVRKGLMIVVMTKQNGLWRISNFHEAEYPDRPVPVIPTQK
jgi:uncharacterized protein (TIGR02246 family)